MELDFTFQGIDDLEMQLTQLSSEDSLSNISKISIKSVADNIYDYIYSNMRVSKDVTKSGRKGSRTFQHAKNNIPKSGIRKKNGSYYMLIGWDKADTSPYFYEKFQEYGTTKIQPNPIFMRARQQAQPQLEKNYKEALEKELQERLG